MIDLAAPSWAIFPVLKINLSPPLLLQVFSNDFPVYLTKAKMVTMQILIVCNCKFPRYRTAKCFIENAPDSHLLEVEKKGVPQKNVNRVRHFQKALSLWRFPKH
jgi:hypothetical protein